MGNMSRPGTIVIDEIDHDVFEVDGERFVVRELVWNGVTGRSFEVVRLAGDEVLTAESFDVHPSDEQIAVVLEEHGSYVETEACKLCRHTVLLATAVRHDAGWVGSCCWGERLRVTS